MFITKEKDEILRKGKLQRGDFVLTTRGTVGNYAFYSDKIEFENIRLNSGMVILRTNQDKGFFNFYLKSPLFKHQIISLQSGTAQPQLPIKDLKTFEILLPPLPEQQAIASVFSSFDDKIELLREQNKTLEEIGQTIFQEWFGKYSVDRPEDLPKGWRVGKIEDLTIQMNSGGTPSTKEESYYNGIINWFSTKELQDNFIFESEKKITDLGLKNSSAKLFPENTIVMAIYAAPTVGRLGILAKESTFNQAAVGLVAKDEIGYPFIYLLLKFLRDELNGLSNGAAQQNLNVGIVKNFKIIIPDQEILKKFNEAIQPIFVKIRDNSEQIQSLTRTRDELLPKLMSGIVRVSDFNKN